MNLFAVMLLLRTACLPNVSGEIRLEDLEASGNGDDDVSNRKMLHIS